MVPGNKTDLLEISAQRADEIVDRLCLFIRNIPVLAEQVVANVPLYHLSHQRVRCARAR